MNQAARAIWTEIMPTSSVFATSAVTQITGSAASNVSRDLRDLEAQGMITRVRRGVWAVVHHPDFSAHAVVPHLFSGDEQGYVSLLSALNLHGMIDQIPKRVQVVTTRQRAQLRTPIATYDFHQMHRAVFGGFGPYRGTGNFQIAGPEKALFDTIYLSARKGRRFTFLPEIDWPESFTNAELERWIAKIEHQPLRAAVTERWRSLAQTAGFSGMRRRLR